MDLITVASFEGQHFSDGGKSCLRLEPCGAEFCSNRSWSLPGSEYRFVYTAGLVSVVKQTLFFSFSPLRFPSVPIFIQATALFSLVCVFCALGNLLCPGSLDNSYPGKCLWWGSLCLGHCKFKVRGGEEGTSGRFSHGHGQARWKQGRAQGIMQRVLHPQLCHCGYHSL